MNAKTTSRNESTTWHRAQRRLEVLAVGRPEGWRMVLQASTEEGSMGGEEKVVQEAGHPGWDKSR